ncbi:glycosyltransferase family 39 protein [Nostoc sp. 'Peltigera malacea cyanobiont' DB3992]|uniref:glycosyltransferase family 39 protein n=1 Tax=Nostoc sp. 'Peltigera malacea cyanobiont' DB3992 TaxID=1206980 RepID=UPI000C04CDF5|nr:glycosyltransferase family 39 protein [Nostoc sp. 'Peltigera malacea cyanobiont' DB3992]PHM11568.1 dolichyl-phosphate-mannose--protein mannosyltransferase [Nostoc sp. 'Peltigera malacea cyanobiont' DB3992]
MDKLQLLAKSNPPTWLKILVISLIGLGIFFRFTHLGQKVYWYDEIATSLAISGHTLAEVKQEVFSNWGNNQGIIPAIALDKYQHINPDRSVADTVRYLITSDPQHPPLYYVMVRLWAQVFGDFPAGVRSLSAVISLLIFPSVYWLCLELFESPLVGWVGMAVMGISPLQVFFAQDAREYGLWMVTILVSSAALLRAIRRESYLSWAVYALTLALGFYTHLLTVMVAIAHGIYVVIRQKFRFRELQEINYPILWGGHPARPVHRAGETPTPQELIGYFFIWKFLNKSLRNYLLSSIAACLMFLPWLIVLITQVRTATNLLSWITFKTDSPFDLIGIWLSRISRIFFDFNLASDDAWVNNLPAESPLFYSIPTIIASFFLIIYIFIFVIKSLSTNASLFIALLGGFPGLTLLFYDLLFGGIRSIHFRYQLPLYLSIQIAVVYILAFHLFLAKNWQKNFWQVIVVALLISGLVSDVRFFQSETWWPQIGAKNLLAMSQLINQSNNNILLVSSKNDYNLGVILTLSHNLEPKVRLLSIQNDQLPIMPQDYKSIFFVDDLENSLAHQLQQDKTNSLKLVYPLEGFWQLDKNQKT